MYESVYAKSYGFDNLDVIGYCGTGEAEVELAVSTTGVVYGTDIIVHMTLHTLGRVGMAKDKDLVEAA